MDNEGGSIWVLLRKQKAALILEYGLLDILYVFVSV